MPEKDLTPTPEFPGLRVRAGTPNTPARGDYVCHCGAANHAQGQDAVRALVDEYAQHQKTHQKESSHR